MSWWLAARVGPKGVCRVASAEQGVFCNLPGELLRRIPTAAGHCAGAAVASSEERREGGSSRNACAAAPYFASRIARSALHDTNM
jgi:hypothetical protein